MASKRFRSRKTLSKSIDRVAQRLRYVEKRTSKTRLNPRVVTNKKLLNKVVTTPKIAENAVTEVTIAENAVGTAQIQPGAVTTTEIAFNAADIGASTSYVSTAQPTNPSVGDIWFDSDDGNKLYQYNGTAFVAVRDTTIAVAQAAANAAQTTADGKNKIYRQNTAPTGTLAEGDLWFNTAQDNKISRYTSGVWTDYGLGNAAIANLDAGKITTGSLDAARIAANTINANMIIANSITSTKIAADAIDGKTITGATLQTSNTVNGKIIIDSTNGFRAIASNGVTTVTITTAGTAAFTGGITATSFTATGLVDGGVGGDLAANTITDANILSLNASKINAGSINAALITVTNLNANNITAGSINAAVIGVTNLNADNIVAGSINAAVISVTNINASNITAGTITGRTIQSDTVVSGGRTFSLGGSGDPTLNMRDSIGDEIRLWALDGLFMKYRTLAVSTKINLTDPTHRMAIDTANATYALEVGGSIRCTGDMRVGGSVIGGGVLTSPLSGNINANSNSFLNVNEIQVDSGSAGDPSFTFTSSTNTGMYYDGDLNFSIGGVNKFYYSNSGGTLQIPSGRLSAPNGHVGNWNPSSNNVSGLGTSSFRWTEVWATDVTINGSDLRLKNTIQDSVLGLDFIEKLRPVSYKWNQGSVTVSGPEYDKEGKIVEGSTTTVHNPGKRPRYGFIAQEVKQVIDDLGVDFGGWIKDDMSDPDSYQSLRYTEFIAPAVKAIQELSEKVKQLEAEVSALKGA